MSAEKCRTAGLRFTRKTVTEAFQMHGEKYSEQRDWNVDYHVELLTRAKKGWAQEQCNDDFRHVYLELRNHWQVFRPMKHPPSAERVWGLLGHINRECQAIKLSSMKEVPSHEMQEALTTTGKLKATAEGPSLMAASKFLHFWNPRLFVIVDRKVMSEYVLQHAWIKNSITALCGRLFEPDFDHYVDFLRWCSAVIREFPFILEAYRAYIERNVRNRHSRAVAHECEAAAIEWFLLGAVELPPG